MSSIYTVTMPDIGEGVVEGEVVSWLKALQDPVAQDEPVVVLMTDKATVELPAPHPGKIVRHYYAVGEIAQKDKPLYDIELAADVPHARPKEPDQPSASVHLPEKIETQVAAKEVPAPAQTSSQGKVLTLPSTRKLAQEMGIDLSRVAGTGKDGRISVEDLKAYTAKAQNAPAKQNEPKETQIPKLEGDEIRQVVGIRGLMAKKMQESHAKIPQFSFFEQADATRLIQLRKKTNEIAAEEGIKVTYMPYFIRALSLTIRKFPELNSSYNAETRQLIIHKQHNIGIAISTAEGLIVPVLKNVQEMSFEELVKAYEQLRKQAEAGTLQSADMREGTITISNFGGLHGGGLWATPVINYPEIAILAIARIHKQAAVQDGELVVKDLVNLSWTFDHRIIDGHAASLYSHHFARLVSNPAELL